MTATVNAGVRRYRVEIYDKELDDLRSRIATTWWPERETVPTTATPCLSRMQDLARSWATSYDMGRCDADQFAAWEQPALFSSELRAAFGTLRSR